MGCGDEEAEGWGSLPPQSHLSSVAYASALLSSLLIRLKKNTYLIVNLQFILVLLFSATFSQYVKTQKTQSLPLRNCTLSIRYTWRNESRNKRGKRDKCSKIILISRSLDFV